MKYKLGMMAVLALAVLMLASFVTAATFGITTPITGSEICGKNGYNISLNDIQAAATFACPVRVDGVLVANLTNSTTIATGDDLSGIVWSATPVDVEGGAFNITCYALGSATEAGNQTTVSIDNTAPSFTITPADGTIIGARDTQTISVTSSDALSTKGLTIDGEGKEVSLASDSYRFTYDLDATKRAPGLFTYVIRGTDNSSCNNVANVIRTIEIQKSGGIVTQQPTTTTTTGVNPSSTPTGKVALAAVAIIVAWLVFIRKKN